MTPDRVLICQWMNAAASGDDAAFGRLATAVQDDLYRFTMAHGLRRDDAAEATQETLLRAYGSRSSWRGGSDAMSWLYGIALNVVREYRRRGRFVAGVDLDGLFPAPAEAGTSSEVLRDLLAAIQRLPPRQREALVCRHLRRLSVRDTAMVMGCAEGTVKAAVAAALKSLRDAASLRHLQEE